MLRDDEGRGPVAVAQALEHAQIDRTGDLVAPVPAWDPQARQPHGGERLQVRARREGPLVDGDSVRGQESTPQVVRARDQLLLARRGLRQRGVDHHLYHTVYNSQPKACD